MINTSISLIYFSQCFTMNLNDRLPISILKVFFKYKVLLIIVNFGIRKNLKKIQVQLKFRIHAITITSEYFPYNILSEYHRKLYKGKVKVPYILQFMRYRWDQWKIICIGIILCYAYTTMENIWKHHNKKFSFSINIMYCVVYRILYVYTMATNTIYLRIIICLCLIRKLPLFESKQLYKSRVLRTLNVCVI